MNTQAFLDGNTGKTRNTQYKLVNEVPRLAKKGGTIECLGVFMGVYLKI